MADNMLNAGVPEQNLLPTWMEGLNRRLGAEAGEQFPDLEMLIKPRTSRTKDDNELVDQLVPDGNGAMASSPRSFHGPSLRPISDPNALMGYGAQLLQGLQRQGAGGVSRDATDPATHPQYNVPGNPLTPQPQPRRVQLPDGSTVTLTPVDHNPFAGVGT